MSSRGWRFWLLLALIAGVSWFARQDFIGIVRSGQFLHSAYSFSHPSFWLMFTVIMLGSVSLGLDTCGRLRGNGMDKIMFPLPFSSMQLIWGRFLGVLFIMLPLSVFGMYSLGVWHYMYGHGYVIWQPFIYAYLFLIMPFMIPIIATAITMRTIFKNDFAALLFGSVLMMAVMTVGLKTNSILHVSQILNHLSNSSPTIGVRLNWHNEIDAFWVHGFYSLLILYLAPLYLRRQMVQQWGASSPKSVIGFSKLLGYFSVLKPDSHLEWGYRISLIALIALCTAGGIRAAQNYQMVLEREKQQEAFHRVILTETAFDMPVDIISYDIEVMPVQENRLPVVSTITFQNEKELTKLIFELGMKYRLDQVQFNGQKVPYERKNDRIYIDLANPIVQGTETSVTLSYHWNEPQVTYEYTMMTGKWYPLPARKILARDTNQFAERDNDIFDTTVKVHLQPGQHSVYTGSLTTQETDSGMIEEWQSTYPVDQIELHWGLFDSVTADRGSYTVRFYHLPYHDYEAQVLLEEVKDQEEYVVERLGAYPFEELVLVETPYSAKEFTFDRYWQQHATLENSQARMPGVIRIPEQILSYCHEGIWLIERMDTDPREVLFYQMLRPTVGYVRDAFYNNYIRTYFEDAMYPTGELAFWVEKYLYSYAAKLLEQNRWRQRSGLNFNIGTSKDKPVHIAEEKSLLTLHQENIYPALEQVRGEGAFRMIHHLLGDDKWWEMLTELFYEYRFQEMPVDVLIAKAEEYYGESLDWFVDQWIYGSVLPEYQVLKAEGRVLENESGQDEFRVYYEVDITVKNHGTGKMGVPIFVETETDFIFRDLWLDSEEEGTLTFSMPSRPLYTSIDPEQWVVQAPYYLADQKRRVHSEMKITIPGDDRGQGARRRMDFWGGRRGRRGGFHF